MGMDLYHNPPCKHGGERNYCKKCTVEHDALKEIEKLLPTFLYILGKSDLRVATSNMEKIEQLYAGLVKAALTLWPDQIRQEIQLVEQDDA